MKKALAIVIAIVLTAALFSACAREERDEHVEPEETKIRHSETDQTLDDEPGDRRRHFRLGRTLRRHHTISEE